MMLDTIVNKAQEIRKLLAEEFPESPKLEKQCKRASILLDMWCQKQGVEAYPMAGFITKPNDSNEYERGHVWNKVVLDDICYIIDIALSQFESYLEKDVPEIVIGKEDDIYSFYHYIEDGQGAYDYEFSDVRFSLVKKMFSNKEI